jgi:hypothetical protein
VEEFRHRDELLVIVVQYFIIVCVIICTLIFQFYQISPWFMYPTHAAYFRNYIRIDNDFSNGGLCTTTSALTIVYWYAALIKFQNINIIKFIKVK